MESEELQQFLKIVKNKKIESLTSSEIKEILKCSYPKASRSMETLVEFGVVNNISSFRKPVNMETLNKLLKLNNLDHLYDTNVNLGPYKNQTKLKLKANFNGLDLKIVCKEFNVPIYVNSKTFFNNVSQYLKTTYSHNSKILLELEDAIGAQVLEHKKHGFIDLDTIEIKTLYKVEIIILNRLIDDLDFSAKNIEGAWYKYVIITSEGYVAGELVGGGKETKSFPDGTLLTRSEVIY